jgi:hypothetical protein
MKSRNYHLARLLTVVADNIYLNNKMQRSWSPFDAKIGTNVAGEQRVQGSLLGGGSHQLLAVTGCMM